MKPKVGGVSVPRNQTQDSEMYEGAGKVGTPRDDPPPVQRRKAHPAERGGPPNWVLVTARILLRALGNIARVLLFPALRIRRPSFGKIGVALIAAAETVRKKQFF